MLSAMLVALLVGSGVAALVVKRGPAPAHEEAVAHEVGQRLAGDLLDDVALNIHGEAVAPPRARLIVCLLYTSRCV